MSSPECNHLRVAAQALVDKLQEIHQDEGYKGIWTVAAAHGICYDGPTYGPELEALTEALTNAGGKAL